MPRPAFDIDLVIRGTPEEVWQRLWDLERHTAAIPLTTVQPTALGPGETFTARTALGPLHLDDTMVVACWEPPRHAVLHKIGRPLRGRIEVTLRPAGRDTRLLWRQRYGATGVPDRLAGVAAPAVRTAYLRALRRITRPEGP